MSNVSFLDLRYKISKNKFLRKPSRWFSARDRQNSGLPLTFQPNKIEMKQVFNIFDANKDGKISKSEYEAILRAIRQENAIPEVPKIFRVVDLDGDGFIDFKEFMEVHTKGGGIRTMDIQNAFRIYDKNDDGKVNAEDILEVLRRLGESCNLEDCQKMVRAVDIDGDGMVDMDEFMTMMTGSMKHG